MGDDPQAAAGHSPMCTQVLSRDPGTTGVRGDASTVLVPHLTLQLHRAVELQVAGDFLHGCFDLLQLPPSLDICNHRSLGSGGNGGAFCRRRKDGPLGPGETPFTPWGFALPVL